MCLMRSKLIVLVRAHHADDGNLFKQEFSKIAAVLPVTLVTECDLAFDRSSYFRSFGFLLADLFAPVSSRSLSDVRRSSGRCQPVAAIQAPIVAVADGDIAGPQAGRIDRHVDCGRRSVEQSVSSSQRMVRGWPDPHCSRRRSPRAAPAASKRTTSLHTSVKSRSVLRLPTCHRLTCSSSLGDLAGKGGGGKVVSLSGPVVEAVARDNGHLVAVEALQRHHVLRQFADP